MSSRPSGPSTLSLLGRRITEAATCELLLLVNFPTWAPVLPFYLLSYIADNPLPPFRSIGAMVRKIRGAIFRSFGLRLLATWPFGGLRFYCDLDGVWLIASEFLRGETSGFVSSREEVFLDVGAHYGLVSARLASLHPRSSRVIAIEAHPANYRVLKSNIELNHLTNIKAFNFAIADFTGTTHMSAHDGVSTHYKLTNENRSTDPLFEVQCYQLPEVVAKLGIDHVDLVKLDIEGLELKVLQTCFPAMASSVGKLDVEVHYFGDVAAIRSLLISNGFDVQVKSWGILSRSYRVIAEKAPTVAKATESPQIDF